MGTRHFDFAEVHSFRLLKEERPKLQFFFTFPSKTITDTMAHLARIANRQLLEAVLSPPLPKRMTLTLLLSSLVQELPPLESQDLVLVLDLSSVPSLLDTLVIHH